MKRCGHCNKLLTEKTFKEHRRLFYDDGEWLQQSSLNETSRLSSRSSSPMSGVFEIGDMISDTEDLQDALSSIESEPLFSDDRSESDARSESDDRSESGDRSDVMGECISAISNSYTMVVGIYGSKPTEPEGEAPRARWVYVAINP